MEKKLKIVQSRKDLTHEVMLGLATISGVRYAVDFVRSLETKKGKFLTGSIRADGKEIWSFKNARYNNARYSGICVVTEISDKVVLCFLSHSNMLEWVVPIEHLRESQMIDGEMITSVDIKEVINLKYLAAREIGVVAKLSPLEEKVSTFLCRKQRDKENAEKIEKRRLKEEKRNEIMSRETISAYTDTGSGRFGKPVTTNEWHCLPNGTRVILVESFNQETGKYGPVLEAFIARKNKGGRTEKENVSKVRDERPAPVERVMARRFITVEMDDGSIRQVPVYSTMGEIQLAQKAGLNGGSLVTSEDQRDEKGEYLVSSINGVLEPKKLGFLRPL